MLHKAFADLYNAYYPSFLHLPEVVKSCIFLLRSIFSLQPFTAGAYRCFQCLFPLSVLLVGMSLLLRNITFFLFFTLFTLGYICSVLLELLSTCTVKSFAAFDWICGCILLTLLPSSAVMPSIHTGASVLLTAINACTTTPPPPCLTDAVVCCLGSCAVSFPLRTFLSLWLSIQFSFWCYL